MTVDAHPHSFFRCQSQNVLPLFSFWSRTVSTREGTTVDIFIYLFALILPTICTRTCACMAILFVTRERYHLPHWISMGFDVFPEISFVSRFEAISRQSATAHSVKHQASSVKTTILFLLLFPSALRLT